MDAMSFFGLIVVVVMVATGLRIRWYLIAAIVFGVNVAIFGDGALTRLFGVSFAVVSAVLLMVGLSLRRSARSGGR